MAVGRRLGQLVLDAYVRIPGASNSNRVLLRLLVRCRDLLAARDDPVVTYRLAGKELLIPLSHNLPLHRKSSPDYLANLGRIAIITGEKYPDLSVIDVGANVGDTVLIMRRERPLPVLCIEADPVFVPLLEHNVGRMSGVEIETSFVSDRTHEQGTIITRSRGTAVLMEGVPTDTRVAFRSLPDIIKDRPNFTNSKLIKIDTDGWDIAVLEGSLALLSQARPVIFFEYDPSASERTSGPATLAVFEKLRTVGYQAVIFYDNEGRYLVSANIENQHLLEDLDALAKRSHGYFDVAAFHAVDMDLFAAIRNQEIARVR